MIPADLKSLFRCSKRWLSGLIPGVLLGYGVAAADLPEAGAEHDYAASIESWREERDRSLRSEDGWLTIAGLYFLGPGDNVFGSDSAAAVVLPPDTADPRAGVIRLEKTEEGVVITVHPEPGVEVLLGGEPVGNRRLTADNQGDPDVLTLGRLRLWVIERGGSYAVRLRDPEFRLRKEFRGIESYELDTAFLVEGRMEGNGRIREIALTNVLGYSSPALTRGPVVFTLKGELCRLAPVVDGPSDSTLFFVFEDETTGRETYGGGRFLYARLEPGGRVLLDFNKAYNPPCAFNPYTTCPLPPEGNQIPVAVRAGEKVYRHE